MSTTTRAGSLSAKTRNGERPVVPTTNCARPSKTPPGTTGRTSSVPPRRDRAAAVGELLSLRVGPVQPGGDNLQVRGSRDGERCARAVGDGVVDTPHPPAGRDGAVAGEVQDVPVVDVLGADPQVRDRQQPAAVGREARAGVCGEGGRGRRSVGRCAAGGGSVATAGGPRGGGGWSRAAGVRTSWSPGPGSRSTIAAVGSTAATAEPARVRRCRRSRWRARCLSPMTSSSAGSRATA